MATPAPRIQDAAGKDLGPAALRTVFRIAERWGLTGDELMVLLGITAQSTFYKWKKEPPKRISPDLLERISYLLGIYKALHILLPNEALADGWLRQPNRNALFGGEPPLARMMSGQVADLYVVRRYLDGERSGW